MQKQSDPATGKTGISWTDYSSNPIKVKRKMADGREQKGWACVKYGPDCEHCYAEVLNKRWGTGLEYSKGNLDQVEFYLDEKEFARWHSVSGQRIFPCDMTDLFGEFMPPEYTQRVLDEMRKCPQNTFQVLTKRAAIMAQAIAGQYGSHHYITQVFPNVWWGFSAGNQEALKRRYVHDLCYLPNLWISVEPMIGPMSIIDIKYIQNVKWVVIGGESQPGCREMDLEWARELLIECEALGIPAYLKQLGGHPNKRANPDDWPEYLRIREYPEALRPKKEGDVT